MRIGLAILLASIGTLPVGCEREASKSPSVTADSEMREAINKGQATLPLFIRAFQEPHEDWMAFQIRYSFKTEAGYQGSVWLELESIEEGGSFVGVIAADEDTRDLPYEPGDRVTVQLSEVTDWSFLDTRGRWYGGYTLRVTMDRRLGTGSDPNDNIHGGTEFVDLGQPSSPDDNEQPGEGGDDGSGGLPD